MIFYYSGTGNSFWVATRLAQALNMPVKSVSDEFKFRRILDYTLETNEPLGFVFPVHSWNAPTVLMRFIKKMRITNYTNQFVFAIGTCGDDSGNAMKLFEKALKRKKLPLHGKWDIVMPNNYISMQDIDNAVREKQKLEKAAVKLKNISRLINIKQPDCALIRGRHLLLKTYLIGFFFKTFGKSTLLFKTTDKCIGCGFCARQCPAGIIKMKKGKPKWKLICHQCYGCINRCPVHAIQCGKATVKRGRYCHPIYHKNINTC